MGCLRWFRRLLMGSGAVGWALLVGATPSSGSEVGAGVGPEGEAFLRAVDAGFKSKERPANDRLQCRPTVEGRGIFAIFKPPTAFTRVALAPVSAATTAFSKRDHFHRFEGAVFQLSICFETPKTKEICIVKPVLRHDGALCVD